MQLDPASIIDRSKLKAQMRRWRLLAAIALLAMLGALFANSANPIKKSEQEHIARVTVEGFIFDEATKIRKLEALAGKANVKAVIVHVNSLGGTVAGGEAYYEAIKYVSKHKPVVVTMGAMATSAGYMVALGGERVFARNGTITASIGVIMQSPDVKVLAEKLGVDVMTLRSGALKGMPSPFEKTSEVAKSQLQGVVEDFFAMFMGMVKENRPVTKADVATLSDGRVVTGRQALELHLVDEIGGERDAMAWLVAEKGLNAGLPIRESKDTLPFERILKELTGAKSYLNGLDFTHFFHYPILSFWQKGATLEVR